MTTGAAAVQRCGAFRAVGVRQDRFVGVDRDTANMTADDLASLSVGRLAQTSKLMAFANRQVVSFLMTVLVAIVAIVVFRTILAVTILVSGLTVLLAHRLIGLLYYGGGTPGAEPRCDIHIVRPNHVPGQPVTINNLLQPCVSHSWRGCA